MVTAERLAILKVGGVAAAVMIMLSLLLASTIAGPVRRLADSAERVRRRTELVPLLRSLFRAQVAKLGAMLKRFADEVRNAVGERARHGLFGEGVVLLARGSERGRQVGQSRAQLVLRARQQQFRV